MIVNSGIRRIYSCGVCQKALKNDEATNFDSRVKGQYNAFLDNHQDIIVRCGNVETKIYPLAHCGRRGVQNRSFDLQKQDWAKI